MRLCLAVLLATGCRGLFGYEDPRQLGDDMEDGAPSDGTPSDAPVQSGDGPIADGPPPMACPASYTTFGINGSFYKVIATADDYAAQRVRCASDGPSITLTIPNNAMELAAIVAAAQAEIWIGINDSASEGTFVTEDGSPLTFTNFAPGEPDDSAPGEDCVMADIDGDWFDRQCNESRRAVCECTP